MAANELARVIKAKREVKGLSVAKAAHEAQVSPAYLSKLESAGVQRPSPTLLHQLAPVLDISYVELMRLAGYVMPNEKKQPTPGLATALLSENLSEEEASHLLTYLKVMRQQQKAGARR
jgi:transcriptional regulator with XRE-family HTH domain